MIFEYLGRLVAAVVAAFYTYRTLRSAFIVEDLESKIEEIHSIILASCEEDEDEGDQEN